jgi:putative transposase
MKKRFPDEQIISVLHKAEAGVSFRELCRSTLFQTLSSILAVRSLAV